MRVLLILTILAAPAAAAPLGAPAAIPETAAAAPLQPPSKPVANSACPPTPAKLAAQLRDKARVHKLTELPPAHAFAAVYRKVDGCEAPVVVRYNIGPQPERLTRK